MTGDAGVLADFELTERWGGGRCSTHSPVAGRLATPPPLSFPVRPSACQLLLCLRACGWRGSGGTGSSGQWGTDVTAPLWALTGQRSLLGGLAATLCPGQLVKDSPLGRSLYAVDPAC